MDTVVIVIHLMAVVALVAVVLLQRSEGGALGMGGGDQFMTMRGQGNVLTRATTILGGIFFATSLAMSILARLNAPPTAILDTAPAAQSAPAAPTTPTTPTTPNTPATAPTGSDTGTPAAGNGASGGGGNGILDQLDRYTNGPSGAVTPKSVVPDTGTPAAPAGSAPADSQAPASSQ